MTTYLVTMAMLLNNAVADNIMQDRIDLARVECAHNSALQLELDRRQGALNEAKKRNLDRIAEIARMN